MKLRTLIVDDQAMSRLDQVLRHGLAHDPQSNESDCLRHGLTSVPRAADLRPGAADLRPGAPDLRPRRG